MKKDILSLQTLLEAGLNNPQIRKYYYENCISCPYPTCTKGFVLAPFGDVLVSEPEQPTGEMPEPLFP